MLQVIALEPEKQVLIEGTLKGVQECPFYHAQGAECPYCGGTGVSAYIVGENASFGVYAPIEDVVAVVQEWVQDGDLVFTPEGELLGNVLSSYGDFVAVIDFENKPRYFTRADVVICAPLIEALKELEAV